MRQISQLRETTEAEVLGLLQEAAVLRLAAAAFAYPDAERRASVRRGFDELEKAQSGRLSAVPWAAAFAAARTCWSAARSELESEYVRLFFGAAPCPLHESAYGDGRRLGGRVVELADIAGFYRAFGFSLSAVRRDLPDHLCAELEFAAALLLKEAYAIAEGLGERREITHAAATEFFDTHLGRWPAALRDALAETAAPEAYLALADFVVALVASHCERLGVAPVLAEGRIDAREEDCLSCPMAAPDSIH